MRIFLTILMLAVLLGCSPWLAMERVDLGMSKSDVLKQLGKPDSVSGAGNEEYFWYTPPNRFWSTYFIRLVDGRVESYGEVSAEAPASQQ